MSINNKVEKIIQKANEGAIIFADDFKSIGSQSPIHTALHRMAKRGFIVRLAQGIYAKPRLSELLNAEVLPTAEEVALAIAERDKARLLPSGSYALHALGLSTQIPLKLLYYTDGKARTLKVGNRTIQFRKASPKKLGLRGKISRLVLQALGEIGYGKVAPEEEKKIIELLQKEDIKDLKHDISLAPQWIAELMSKSLKK